jgi:hypothetical protein
MRALESVIRLNIQCSVSRTAGGRAFRPVSGRLKVLRIAEAVADSHYVLTWRDPAADALPSTRRPGVPASTGQS